MSAPFAHPVSSNSPSTLPGSESPAPSCSPISLQPNTSPTGPDASNESSPITPAFPTYNNADGKWYKSFASLHSHTGNLNVLNQTFVPTLEQQQLLAESLDANLGIWSSPREGNVEDEPVNCSSSDAVVMTTSFLDTMMNAQQPSGLQQKEDYIHEQMFQSPRWVPNGMIGANTNTDIPVAPHGHSQTYQSEYTSYEWPPLNYVHPPQWTEPINMAGNLPEGDTVLPPPNGHLGDYNSLQQHRYNHSIRAAHDYARWVNMEQHKLPHVLSPLHRTLPPLRIPAPIPSSEVQCDERPKPCVTPGGQFAKLPEKVLQMIIERLTLLSYTRLLRCSTFFGRMIQASPWSTRIQFILKASKSALLATVKSGILDYFNLRALNVFFDWQCITCGAISNYIFIPRLCRVCPYCLIHDPYFDVIIRSTAQALYQLTDKALKAIPKANLVTGSNVNRFHLLVARGFAHKVALARYGSDQKIAELVREADEKKQEKYDKQMENWRLENPDSDDEKEKTGFNTKASSVQKGRSRQKKGNIVAKTERSKPPKAPRLSSHYTESMGPEVKEAVSVVASFIDVQTGHFVGGFGCDVCRGQNKFDTPVEYSRYLLTVYTEEQLKKHIEITHSPAVPAGARVEEDS